MRSHLGIHDRISDAINPIAVKELRQAVHSNFLVAALVLFLGIQLLIVGLFLANESLSGAPNAGRSIFSALIYVLLVASLLFVPAYAGIRLAIERSVDNVDLLFITTLRPWSVIWGKFLAALALTVLFFSVGMPFIVSTYLLRGIDLLSIFGWMAINFVVVAVCIQCAILIGAVSLRWRFKLILGMMWLGFLIAMVLPLFRRVGAFGGLLDILIVGQLSSGRFWNVLLGVLISGLTIMGIIGLLAAAAISPRSANRALPVRAFATVAWLLTGVFAGIWSYNSNTVLPVGGWGFLHILLHAVGLFVAVSERESAGMRLRLSIPREWLLRPFAFLFYSGAAGGVAWSCLTLILTFVFIGAWVNSFPGMVNISTFLEFFFRLSIYVSVFLSHALGTRLLLHGHQIRDFDSFFVALVLFALYAFSYALGASLIRRRFFANRVSACHTWVIGFVLFGISTTIIPMIFFFFSGTWDIGCFIASPIGAFMYLDDHPHLVDKSAAIALGSAIFVGVFSLPWFMRQYRSFQPVWQRRVRKPLTE